MAASKKEVAELAMLEEDDEFEEFECDGLDFGAKPAEDSVAPKWQDNWDDEDVDDSFIDQLRSELAKTSTKMDM